MPAPFPYPGGSAAAAHLQRSLAAGYWAGFAPLSGLGLQSPITDLLPGTLAEETGKFLAGLIFGNGTIFFSHSSELPEGAAASTGLQLCLRKPSAALAGGVSEFLNATTPGISQPAPARVSVRSLEAAPGEAEGSHRGQRWRLGRQHCRADQLPPVPAPALPCWSRPSLPTRRSRPTWRSRPGAVP